MHALVHLARLIASALVTANPSCACSLQNKIETAVKV